MSAVEDKAVVRKEKLWVVVGNHQHRVNNKLDDKRTPLDAWDIVSEAERWVGLEVPYNISCANCEHFVTKLRYGQASSSQVETAIGVGLGVGGAIFLGAIATACYQIMKPRNQHKK
ncbi:phospholipase A and acyltransferase 3-like isoform X1 [Callorhinchus milii]|nr:phospholipase A and acyltransferase 3-like isoform X1 [Callorhinchus milii]